MLTDGGAAGPQGGTSNAGTGGGTPGQGSGGSFVVGSQHGVGGNGAQGAPGAGGSTGGDHGGPGGRHATAADGLQRLIDRYGPDRAADILYRENFDLREERRQLDVQMRNRPELPAGAVVLVGNDVAEWNAVRALNLPAAQIRERITEHQRLQAESSRTQTQTLAEKAAAAYQWGSAAVIGELVTDKGLQLDMRDTTIPDGKGGSVVKPMPYVRKATDTNGVWHPLREYVTQNHAGYLPALTVPAAAPAAGTGTPGAQGAPAGTAAAPAATAAAPAHGAQGAPAAVVVFGETPATPNGQPQITDPVEAILAQNRAAADAPNALRPAAPATR